MKSWSRPRDTKGRFTTGGKIEIHRDVLYKLYHEEGKNTIEIGRELGYGKHVIRRRLAEYGIPCRDHSLRRVRLNLDNLKDLAYVLGVMKGDGSAFYDSRGIGGSVQLNTIDEQFADSFETALGGIGLHPYHYINCGGMFSVLARSKSFVNWYKKLTLDNIHEKIRGNEKEFTRGFYESEGSIRWSRDKRDSKSRLNISIGNTDLQLLEFVKKMFDDLGIMSTIYGPYQNKGGRKPIYELKIQQRNQAKFIEMMNPVIKRTPRCKTKEEVDEFVKIIYCAKG